MPSIIIYYFDEVSPEKKPLLLNVPCEYRATCYQSILEQCYAQFRAFLTKQEPEHATVVKDALLNVNLLENLAVALDNILLDFLATELEGKWPKEHLEKLSPAESRNLLIQFYTNPRPKYPNLSLKEHLLTKYPKLAQLVNDVSKIYVDNILTAVGRVIENYELLARKFLKCSSPSEHPQLVKITLSESGDKHKLGAQVCILDFRIKNYQVKRIVYKPFSVKADALITGKTVSPSKNSLFFNVANESFIELLNKHLPTQLKLPTYLIMPCVSDTIKDDYGFIEYIEHEPWPHLSFNLLIQDYVQSSLSKNLTDNSYLVYKYVNDKFLEELKKLHIDNNSDFIIDINDQFKLQTYSKQCGILLAVMLILKITDMHIENLIVHGNKPHLIDLELAFQPKVNSIEQTVSLDPTIGAMRAEAITPYQWRYLYDAAGVQFGEVALPCKNRLYLRDQAGKLIPYEPDVSLLKEGFSLALNIFHNNHEVFLQWLDNKAVKSLTVRVIPFGTSELKNIGAALSEKTTQKQWDNYIANYIKNNLVSNWLNELRLQNQAWLNEWSALQETNSVETPKITPVFVPLHFKVATIAYFTQEYNAKSLPAFYTKIDETKIYNALGKSINIKNAEIILNISKKLTDEDRALITAIGYNWHSNDYYQKQPILEVKAFITHLSNENFKKSIEIAAHQEINVCYNITAQQPVVHESSQVKSCNII